MEEKQRQSSGLLSSDQARRPEGNNAPSPPLAPKQVEKGKGRGKTSKQTSETPGAEETRTHKLTPAVPAVRHEQQGGGAATVPPTVVSAAATTAFVSAVVSVAAGAQRSASVNQREEQEEEEEVLVVTRVHSSDPQWEHDDDTEACRM